MPVSVGRPMAAANSATLNSATSGAPGPATVIPVSPYLRSQIVAASVIESTECMAAQVTACCRRSGLGLVGDRAVERARRSSTAAAVSAWASVSVMGPVKPDPPTFRARIRPRSGVWGELFSAGSSRGSTDARLPAPGAVGVRLTGSRRRSLARLLDQRGCGRRTPGLDDGRWRDLLDQRGSRRAVGVRLTGSRRRSLGRPARPPGSRVRSAYVLRGLDDGRWRDLLDHRNPRSLRDLVVRRSAGGRAAYVLPGLDDGRWRDLLDQRPTKRGCGYQARSTSWVASVRPRPRRRARAA